MTEEQRQAEAGQPRRAETPRQRNLPDAVKHLNDAARLDARWPDVYVHLALAYSALGDRKNVEECLKQALR